MRRTVSILLLALSVCVPLSALAQNAGLSRRDGFLLLWDSIRRAVEDNREKPFTDVPDGAKGFAEITYAKYRGILDDTDAQFHPDAPLTLDDALVWLFRTRSVDDLKKIDAAHLPALLARYPVVPAAASAGSGVIKNSASVSEEQLTALMRTLDDLLAHEQHEVSLYGEEFNGQGTAFGETFDMNALTAAHRTFPYNTLVRVTNVENGKSVTVRINDRGPYVPGRDMDLSVAAFTAIADRGKGVIHATFQRLGDATLVGQCSDSDSRRAVRITKNVRLIGGIPATLPLGKSITLQSTRAFVLHSITYPDGTVASLEDWVLIGETHPFTPSVEGTYTFDLGSKDGHRRPLMMQVVHCAS